MKDQPDVTTTDPSFLENDVLVENNDEDKTEAVPGSNQSIPLNNKDIVDANSESHPRIQHKINIPEVRNPIWTVFNELFVQQVLQDAQGLVSEMLYYHIIGLVESATKDD